MEYGGEERMIDAIVAGCVHTSMIQNPMQGK
jgi:hypothetical protein